MAEDDPNKAPAEGSSIDEETDGPIIEQGQSATDAPPPPAQAIEQPAPSKWYARKRWWLGAVLIVIGYAIGAVGSYLLWPARGTASNSLITLVSSRPSSEAKLRAWVESYPMAGDPCTLPSVDELAQWHGAEFQTGAEPESSDELPESVGPELERIGIKVLLSRAARAGHPWVALVPEYHGHEESEELISRISSVLADSLGVSQVQVFVEAWSKALRLPQRLEAKEEISGIEDMDIYPVSRAAWGLIDLTSAPPPPELGELEGHAREVLLERPGVSRLMVGEHPSRGEAEGAMALYAWAWNAITTQLKGTRVSPIPMPVGADYYEEGRWVEVARTVQLAVPTSAEAYRKGSRLHLIAKAMAAVTSRIRTAEYAFHVLETLSPENERAALVQVGANHMQPLIDLLERAGVGVVVLLTPKSKHWSGAKESWRCPVSLLDKPYDRSLGYFRLPGSEAQRKKLNLCKFLPTRK